MLSCVFKRGQQDLISFCRECFQRAEVLRQKQEELEARRSDGAPSTTEGGGGAGDTGGGESGDDSDSSSGGDLDGLEMDWRAKHS